MLIIDSIRKKPETILKKHPNAILADVTSHAADDLKKLSPFYPHGGIPVPFSEGVTAMCVEAVWQGARFCVAARFERQSIQKNHRLRAQAHPLRCCDSRG